MLAELLPIPRPRAADMSEQDPDQVPAAADLPVWCGQCEEPARTFRLGRGNPPLRCPYCHPDNR